jgi:hypothetical protein
MCNPSTNTITATAFVGDLSGNATTATMATNIAGGAGGSIPYQTAVNTTALLANGTAGQVLTSAGTTLAPIWSTSPTWTAYTPDFGATFTLGNGNVSAYYANQGKLTHVYIDIGWGSTTAFGPAINPVGLVVSLPPFPLTTDINFNTLVQGEDFLNGTQLALDGSVTFTQDTASNGGVYGQVIYFPPGGIGTRGQSTIVKLAPYYLSGNYLVAPPIPGLSATVPFTWGENSRITAFFNYPTL